MRPADGVEEEKPAGSEQQRPAVLLNLFLGGGEDKPIRVIEGQAREVGAPVRLAGEAVQGDRGTGFRRVGRGFGTRFRALSRVCHKKPSRLRRAFLFLCN